MGQKVYDVEKYAVHIDSISEKKYQWGGELIPSLITNLKFPGEVLLDRTKTQKTKLIFEHCIFDTISIKNETPDLLRRIEFIDCRIGKINVFRSTTSVVLIESEADEITVNQTQLDKLRFERSKIHEVSLEEQSHLKQFMVADCCEIDLIDEKEAKIERLTVNSSQIRMIRIHDMLECLELSERSTLERFEIDNKLTLMNFVRLEDERLKKIWRGTRSQREVELRYQIQITLAAYNQYNDENRFFEMDIFLHRLRRLSCVLNFIEASSLPRKFHYMIEYLLIGVVLGWGVNILNTVITSFVTICIFAALYLSKFIEMTNTLGKAIELSFETSVVRFFCLDPNETYHLLEHCDPLEQLIGVIMLTILTGVIARKIIR